MLTVISGVLFYKALFVPNQSQYNKLGSHASPPAEPQQVDLSWQLSLQRAWEKLLQSDRGSVTLEHLFLVNNDKRFQVLVNITNMTCICPSANFKFTSVKIVMIFFCEKLLVC